MPTTSLFEYVSHKPAHNSIEELPLTPEELEFIAEHERVMVVPNFSLSTPGSMLHCIEGSYGPFQPNIPVEVPLYIALALYRRNKCRIQPPEWLHKDNLSRLLEEERQISQVFQPVPFFYMEISKMLCAEAKEIFEGDYSEVSQLLEEFKKVRNSKILDGLRKVSGAVTGVKLANLSATEINKIRLLFENSLNAWAQIGKNDKAWQEEGLAGSASLPI